MYPVRNRWSWVCLLPTALLIVAQFAWGDTLSGKVVGVADGDTVTVLDADHQQHKIRLQGIDALEETGIRPAVEGALEPDGVRSIYDC